MEGAVIGIIGGVVVVVVIVIVIIVIVCKRKKKNIQIGDKEAPILAQDEQIDN